MCHLEESHELERFSDSRGTLMPGDVVKSGRERQVLGSGQATVGRHELRDVPNGPAHTSGFARHIPTRHMRGSRRWREQRRQHLDRCRLARTVRAEEAEDRSGFDSQVEMVHGDQRVEAACKRGGRDGRRLDCFR